MSAPPPSGPPSAGAAASAANASASASASASANNGEIGQLECVICLHLINDNRQCPRCNHLFCEKCLTMWLQARPIVSPVMPGDEHGCPACRFPCHLSAFLHNIDKQAQADAHTTQCEFGCGETFQWGTRKDHALVCKDRAVPCPFAGCDFTGPRNLLDQHTYACPFSDKYTMGMSLDAILGQLPSGLKANETLNNDNNNNNNNNGIVRASAPSAAAASAASAASAAAAAESDPADDAVTAGMRASMPPDTVLHRVTDNDTMSGLCIRYNCERQVIRRLNKLMSDDVCTRSVLIVPKPADYEPQKCDIPKEVLEALRRRRLARQMVRLAKIQPEEAVTYLLMTGYDFGAAMQRCKEDDEWEKAHVHTPPASLKDFLFRLESRKESHRAATGGRHHCPHPLSEWRTSCASCGDKCCVTCSMRMLKKTLGVTNPHTMNDAVVCCMECFARLCKMMAPENNSGSCCKGKGHSI